MTTGSQAFNSKFCGQPQIKGGFSFWHVSIYSIILKAAPLTSESCNPINMYEQLTKFEFSGAIDEETVGESLLLLWCNAYNRLSSCGPDRHIWVLDRI